MQENKHAAFSLKWDEMQKIIRDPVLLATIILVGLSLILFIVWPLYVVLAQSFLSDSGTLTFEYYRESLKHSENIRVLLNTIVLGLFVSFFATAIGFLFAYADAFLKIKYKKIFNVIAILPIISPPLCSCNVFYYAFWATGFY